MTTVKLHHNYCRQKMKDIHYQKDANKYQKQVWLKIILNFSMHWLLVCNYVAAEL